MFFQDPISHDRHPLPWTGMPQADQMPAFGDARARDLLRKAAAAGRKPKSDADLLPVLLHGRTPTAAGRRAARTAPGASR
ncbi:hypothetical protein ACWC4D_29865 [Streptomyces sp. NPDC001288]|uniref:hypothetical protein n=1 Tax=unclassified Streptomyces TaxID=2593676 RepID=UPI00332AA15A